MASGHIWGRLFPWGRNSAVIRSKRIISAEKLTVLIDSGVRHAINLRIKCGKPVYVHCLGGIGRTGTVVGCYLVRHGLSTGKNILDIIRDLRKDCVDSGRESLKTREQRKMVQGWTEKKLTTANPC